MPKEKKQAKKEKKVGKWLFWTPRILSIIFILFLALFSFDVFESCSGFLECALALFMHNLPSLLLLVVLIISWKHELVGAITFILAGTLYIVIMVINALTSPFEWYVLSYSFIIAGPAFFIGILFFINWYKKKK